MLHQLPTLTTAAAACKGEAIVMTEMEVDVQDLPSANDRPLDQVDLHQDDIELPDDDDDQDYDLDGILRVLESIDRSTFSRNDASRIKAVAAARALALRLETPWETTNRIVTQEPTLHMALKLAVDIGLLNHLGAPNSPARNTIDLANATLAEPSLVRRILRHLAAMNVVRETGPDLFTATEFSTTIASPEGAAPLRCLLAEHYPVYAGMPHFLLQRGYKAPTDARNGCFQYVLGDVGHTHFEWMGQPSHRHQAENFTQFMKFMTQHRRSWMDICDNVDTLVTKLPPTSTRTTDTSAPPAIFVDVGGGIGHDAAEFRRRFPPSQNPPRVVLQELPHVAAQARQGENGAELARLSVDIVDHDFFTAQPVVGARIYYMGGVMHDWPDADARRILQNIRSAMTKGYSRLLLAESVVPLEKCPPQLSGIDMTMMAMLSSHERTENEWRALLEGEGFKLVKIHADPSSFKCILEAELS